MITLCPLNRIGCKPMPQIARILFVIAALILLTAQNSPAQNDFPAFWKKFKSAVVAGDKAAVAGMTNFPMSIYESKIDNRAEFFRRYRDIFDGEANGARCFPSAAEPQRESKRRYAVYCPFKHTPNDRENAPIRFIFELSKSGWKFVGLDNINE